MKKLLCSVFTLMLFVSLANATTFEKVEVKKDCHATACMVLGFIVDHYGDDVDVDSVYENVYNSCMNYQ